MTLLVDFDQFSWFQYNFPVAELSVGEIKKITILPHIHPA